MMAIDPKIRDNAAEALLNRITEATDDYTDPGNVEQLAQAYALVAGNTPTSKDANASRGGGKVL